MKHLSVHSSKEENYIIELFKLLLPYKWLIITMMSLSLVLAQVALYFIPSTYESYAIIKVNTDNNQVPTEDLIRESLFKTGAAGMNQEMSILQTFQVNNKALEHVNFQVQYFVEEGYKKVELYNQSPIDIREISNRLENFDESYILLSPKKNGFTLSSKRFGESQVYPYAEEIKTSYFKAKVFKKVDFTTPLYLQVQGDNRSIYEEIIKKRLDISQVEAESNLIRISFQDSIPQRANNYVNALIEAYIAQSINKKNSTNNKTLQFIDEQLAVTKSELEVAEKALEEYQAQNSSIDPSVKSTNFFEKLSDVDLQLSEITLKEKLINNLKLFIQHNKNLDAIAPSLLEFNDQSTIKMIDNLNRLQIEADELALEFTENYPRLVQLRKRIKDLRAQVVLNVKNLGSVLALKRANLMKQKNKYESILTSLPKKEKKLISYKRNYEVTSKMYTYLLEKKAEQELLKVASIADYEAIDKAYTPSKPIKPRKLVFMVIALLIGLGLGVLIGLLRALTMDKVKTQKDVELLTKLPIYGNIPLYKDELLMNIGLEESYRKLAMNLQFFKKEGEANVVLISSLMQGEGKTTTLVQLSHIIEKTRYKSIIIDLDMRHPSLHEHFGLEQQYSGISTYLSERDNLGNIIFTTNHPHLNIITSGPIPPNPVELTLSARLETLIETLKQRYDYIFIDTGSFDVAEETFYLMQYSDINLIVIRENVSKKSSITDLEKIVRNRGLKNVGLVLKTVPPIVKKKELLGGAKQIQEKKTFKLLT